jgi:hypothetical protein
MTVPARARASTSLVLRTERQASPLAPARDTKNLALAALIESWLGDESGHDEKLWPLLEKDLEEAAE